MFLPLFAGLLPHFCLFSRKGLTISTGYVNIVIYEVLMTLTNEDITMSNEKLTDVLVRKLGIYELRALAREMGVPSPTTKRRNELVELILENKEKVKNSGIANAALGGKKGRPFKKLGTIDEIMDAVINEDDQKIEAPVGRPTYEKLICFAQEMPQFEHVAKEFRILTGVLRMANLSTYFIDNKFGIKVFIPEEKIEEYNLSKGDFIKARCVKINNLGHFMADKLMEINFIDVDKYVVKSLQKNRPIISREKFPFGNAMICCGRRNVVEYSTDIFEDENFEDFAKDCQSRGVKVVVAGLNISFENDIMYDNLEGITTFTTVYGSDASLGVARVVDAIAFCEKMNDRGEKTLLFINDMVEVLRTLDKNYFNPDNNESHAPESVVIAQKILSLGRAYEGGLWTTLLVAYRDVDKNNDFLNNELFKVSVKI